MSKTLKTGDAVKVNKPGSPLHRRFAEITESHPNGRFTIKGGILNLATGEISVHTETLFGRFLKKDEEATRKLRQGGGTIYR